MLDGVVQRDRQREWNLIERGSNVLRLAGELTDVELDVERRSARLKARSQQKMGPGCRARPRVWEETPKEGSQRRGRLGDATDGQVAETGCAGRI